MSVTINDFCTDNSFDIHVFIVQCPVLITHVFISLMLHFLYFIYLLKLMLTDFCIDCSFD